MSENERLVLSLCVPVSLSENDRDLLIVYLSVHLFVCLSENERY